MVKRTIKTEWQFSRGAWATAIRDAVSEHGYELVGAMIGVHPNTIRQWGKDGSTTDDYPYPSMTSFTLFCREFDVDPRDMFETVDTAHVEEETTVVQLHLPNPDIEWIKEAYEGMGYRVVKIDVLSDRYVAVTLGAGK